MFIIQALYFFLPAYVSNMTPVIFGRYNILQKPIDFNKKVNNKPMLGAHKTWGGLLYGTIAGTAIFYVQQELYSIPVFQSLSLFNYNQSPIILGILLASGALIGDAVKSFFKRRMNKNDGEAWFPFDQIDYVIGALVCAAPLYVPSLKIIMALLVLAPFLHYAANHIAFFLRLKSVNW